MNNKQPRSLDDRGCCHVGRGLALAETSVKMKLICEAHQPVRRVRRSRRTARLVAMTCNREADEFFVGDDACDIPKRFCYMPSKRGAKQFLRRDDQQLRLANHRRCLRLDSTSTPNSSPTLF